MMNDPGIFEQCVLCDARTRHVKGCCLICQAKDEQEVQEALERFRIAEGANDPFQGDIFGVGDNLNPGMN